MKFFLFSSLITLFSGLVIFNQNGPDPVFKFNADNGYDDQTIRKPVKDGDKIGKIQFRGWTNEQDKWFLGAELGTQVNGVPSSEYLPADMYFSTGAYGPVERMRIKENGKIGINIADPEARFSIYDFGSPMADIFEVIGGASGSTRRFHIGNMADGSLRALLQGNMEVEVGNLVVKNGKMGIGVEPNDMPGNHKLYVNGGVLCTELNVELKSDWPDYIFINNYPLRSLDALRAYIKKEGHLPGIPSAEEVRKNGINVGEMFKNVVEHVEILNLYILQQQQTINDLTERVKHLESNGK